MNSYYAERYARDHANDLMRDARGGQLIRQAGFERPQRRLEISARGRAIAGMLPRLMRTALVAAGAGWRRAGHRSR